MDCKSMWEELRERLESDKAFYADGLSCSTQEPASGFEHTADLLQIMDFLEYKYGED